MSFPSTIEAPDWVNWIAQDENGSWWGFSVEPLEHSSGWYENEVGKYIRLTKSLQDNNGSIENWKETLTKLNP